MLQALNSGSEITLKESNSQKLAEDYRKILKSKTEDIWKYFMQYNMHMTGHAVIHLFWCGTLSHFLPFVIISTTVNTRKRETDIKYSFLMTLRSFSCLKGY